MMAPGDVCRASEPPKEDDAESDQDHDDDDDDDDAVDRGITSQWVVLTEWQRHIYDPRIIALSRYQWSMSSPGSYLSWPSKWTQW